jgi:P27 family predicted phage terminase small subunit
MPEVVSFDKMGVGKKQGGKHWTKTEVKKRAAAAQKTQRKKKVKLICPVWLDDEGRRIWKKTLKNMAGLEILDKVDEDVLAVYCDAVARYQEATLKVREEGYTTINAQGVEIANPNVKIAQSYARITLQYSEKLGLNANSRARLAKKIADNENDPNADLFD